MSILLVVVENFMGNVQVVGGYCIARYLDCHVRHGNCVCTDLVVNLRLLCNVHG